MCVVRFAVCRGWFFSICTVSGLHAKRHIRRKGRRDVIMKEKSVSKYGEIAETVKDIVEKGILRGDPRVSEESARKAIQ